MGQLGSTSEVNGKMANGTSIGKNRLQRERDVSRMNDLGRPELDGNGKELMTGTLKPKRSKMIECLRACSFRGSW